MAIGAIDPNHKNGTCEVCDSENLPLSLHYGNMWFCEGCWEKEQAATKENERPEAIQARIDAVNDAVKESQKIDSTIQVRTDLFNAGTVAILELKKEIDADDSVTNKPYQLASILKERFDHYKQVMFELNEQIIEAGNNQKAIQIYLNTLANQLRAEEREKLRISDISYSPTPVKKPTVKKIGTSQTSKKTKLDVVELRKYAAELQISEFTLRMVAVQKGLTVEQAANVLRRSIAESKSESE